jgi:hypothetical protein
MHRKKAIAGPLSVFLVGIGLFTISCRRSEENTPEAKSSSLTLLTTNIAATSNQTNFPIFGVGVLHFPVPMGWNVVSRQAPPESVPMTTILFSSPPGTDFVAEFTALYDKDKKLAVNARTACQNAMENARPQALETNLQVQDLSGPEFFGHYFSITDKNLVDRIPPPGEYKYLVQGTAKMAQLVISFKIYSNHPDGADRKAALEMIRQVRFVPR